jgi:hypothetical protein
VLDYVYEQFKGCYDGEFDQVSCLPAHAVLGRVCRC